MGTATVEYSHSATWSEICAQPAIWRGWADALESHAREVRDWVATEGFEDVIFAGAGTSAFIGDILVRPAATGPRLHAIPTTDIVSNPLETLVNNPKTLVVQFGRSGSSSESVGTLDLLDAQFPDVARLHITCNSEGALATRTPRGRGAQKVILLPEATHDSGFAMTSSFSTMLLTAEACFGAPSDLRARLDALSAAAERLVALFAQKTPARPGRAVFLGSGAYKGAAREAALKVLELTAGRTVTAWDSTLGFRHGPKSILTGADLVVVGVHPDTHAARYDRDVVSEIRAQFPETTVVSLGSEREDIDLGGSGHATWDAVLYVLAAQVWATQWSAVLGLNIDNPFVEQGNLSRVVSGVTLYPLEA
ncbi:SIS domain-containing protein [Celeribacter indicus]|uniref:Tagatose-6-phosphate ketose/aldose isomerase n=1 Tax=Celeribacter indicus TaxID=1208324 RepID=A0A0B5E0E4_9RHOB|nr:SIS domain-containing protein [Celeribacter indicus]AJE48709.1 tagatose-6-phosphate ketose/aldose isomerase [Celeribacter indicus]SDX12414.1 tagatose-6-phosphate ketose/aldose isomerase [Celeribacter indicus]